MLRVSTGSFSLRRMRQDYAKRTISEMAKFVRVSLEGGHARVRNRKTGWSFEE